MIHSGISYCVENGTFEALKLRDKKWWKKKEYKTFKDGGFKILKFFKE